VGNACTPTVVGESKDSGKVGSTATIAIDAGSQIVVGTDGRYEVRWSNKPIGGEATDYIVLIDDKAPPNSTKVTVSFTVPEAAYGTNYVQFYRHARPEDPYGFSFMVLPDIKVSPSSASPGSKVTINGTGFPAKEEGNLSFDGKDTKLTISVNEKGSFETDFTLPNTIAGKHELKAGMKLQTIADISTSFQVQPAIALNPESPEIGGEVTVTGCGFAATSQVSIKFDDVTISSSPTTDDMGNFTHSFKVPESSKTNHVVVATDKGGNTATFGLTLESDAPESPSTISPLQERYGMLGPQLVIFTWTEVSDPSGVIYILEIDNDLQFFPLAPGMRKTGLTKPSCAVRLEPGTYYWRVKAIDGAGNESDWTLSPYPFKVGLFSALYLALGGIVFVIAFVFIVRAFFRRVREYYK